MIQTKAQQEERAESNLKAYHVETFLPKVRQRRENPFGGKPYYNVKPLFTRYIFARFKADELLHKVSFTRGVKSVVNFGGHPTAVDDEVIELLRKHSDAEGCLQVGEELKAGDKVLISRGPFRSFVGIIEGKTVERQRVSILLKAVSWPSRVIVDRDVVKKLT